MRMVKHLRHTTSLGEVLSVSWTPGGLEIRLNGDLIEPGPGETEANFLEYGTPPPKRRQRP